MVNNWNNNFSLGNEFLLLSNHLKYWWWYLLGSLINCFYLIFIPSNCFNQCEIYDAFSSFNVHILNYNIKYIQLWLLSWNYYSFSSSNKDYKFIHRWGFSNQFWSQIHISCKLLQCLDLKILKECYWIFYKFYLGKSHNSFSKWIPSLARPNFIDFSSLQSWYWLLSTLQALRDRRAWA